MKSIQIKGGLGNQLFQYAYGRNLELSGKKIIFDISFYNRGKAKIDTPRDFKLNSFNIETKAQFLNNKHSLLENLIEKILVKIKLKRDGFFQSEKYFLDIRNILLKEFTLKSPLSTKSQQVLQLIQTTPNSISIHIRRGDYVQDKKTNAFHGTCSPKYYKNALEFISSKITKQNSNLLDIRLFIFSDDINWVKENMLFPYPTTYVSSPEIPDYEELILMSKCQHNIIANSSFSWWGAWLNQNPNKIVIAPRRWVLKCEKDFKDIVPESWYRV